MRPLEPALSASWAGLTEHDTVSPDTGLKPEAPTTAAGPFDGRAEEGGRDGREGAGPAWQSAGIERPEAGSRDGEQLADDAWLPAAQPPQAAAVPGRAAAAQAGPPPAVAEQVAAAAAGAMSQGQFGPGTVSVSLDPDELGRIGITVELKADGTTTVHVQAERLATLDLLRADQAVLMRALDRPGHDEGSHALSFSWSGGGQPEWEAWGPMDDSSGPAAPAAASGNAYAPAKSPQSARAPSRGGVDVTA